MNFFHVLLMLLVRRVLQLAFIKMSTLCLLFCFFYKEKTTENSAIRELYFQLADAISHWLWKLTPALSPVLEEVAKSYEHIILG